MGRYVCPTELYCPWRVVCTMMKNLVSLLVLPCMLVSMLGAAVFVSTPVQAGKCSSEVQLLPGATPWYSGLCKEGTNEIQITSPAEDSVKIGLNVLSFILIIAGYVAVGFVIWGGFKYMLASGDSGKISSAKQTIQNALIGLLIALSAAAIVTFIGGSYGIA